MRYVILSPDAEEDLLSTIRWYLDKETELSLRFEAELDMVLAGIAGRPYQFPVVGNSIRQALMKRFPYAVYFTVRADTVLVTGILHQRRQNPWRNPAN